MASFLNFTLNLPDTVVFNYINPGDDDPNTGGTETVGGGLPSYFDIEITDTSLIGNYDAYCIDTDRGINRDGTLTAQVYSSYDPNLPPELIGPGNIEKPENLDLINWILNQNFVGQTAANGAGDFTFGDVQRAIWELIDDTNSTGALGPWTQEKADQIIALAQANGENFVPSYEYTTYFGEEITGKLGVILIPENNRQFIIAEVELSKLGNFVFNDLDADGVQDTGEAGIAGVTVNLLADVDGDGVIEDNEVIHTTTTDANGEYHFEVIAGDYKVQFEQPNGFSRALEKIFYVIIKD